jgi:hypothetical protein
MESVGGLVAELPGALASWVREPAGLGPRLRALAARLAARLEAAGPEELPGMVDCLLGARGSQEAEPLTLLSFSLGLAKDQQKERAKDGGDFLRDVAELLGTLLAAQPALLAPRLTDLLHLARVLFFCHPAVKVRLEALRLVERGAETPGARAAELGMEELAAKLRHTMAARLAPSLLAQLRRLMGVMVRAFPQELAVHQLDLRTSYVRELTLALRATTVTLDLGLVEGTLRGLAAILAAFPPEEGEDPQLQEELYDLLRRLCRRPEQEEGGGPVRRGAMRAALDLFAAQCGLFRRQVAAEARHWYPLLESWLEGTNREDTKAGWRAMDAFVDVVGEGLGGQGEGGQATPAALAFLVGQFKAVLLAPESSHRAVGLAIQGWGACRAQYHSTGAEWWLVVSWRLVGSPGV